MADGTQPMRLPSFIAPATIIESVAGTMGTTVAELLGKRVFSNLNAARQITCLLFAEFTLLSMVEMGFALGRRNDTAGRHCLIVARARLQKDQRFRGAFEQARQGLLKGFEHG